MNITPSDGKFTAEDIAELRLELQRSGLDSWQSAELVSSFMGVRGYGVSSEGARGVITRIDATHCNLDCMRAELERLALPM